MGCRLGSASLGNWRSWPSPPPSGATSSSSFISGGKKALFESPAFVRHTGCEAAWRCLQVTYPTEKTLRAVEKVDRIIDAFLAELDCDSERFVYLCVELAEAVAEAQMQIVEELEVRLPHLAGAHAQAYQESTRLYDTHMDGFLMALSMRRHRLGLDGSSA